MKRYHITFRKNGILCFTNFAYHSEEEKDEHLKYWKEKHVSPYNKIEILMHGEDNLDCELKKTLILKPNQKTINYEKKNQDSN